MAIVMNDEEAYACLRRFDTADDGRVNYSEFCHMLADVIEPGVGLPVVTPMCCRPA